MTAVTSGVNSEFAQDNPVLDELLKKPHIRDGLRAGIREFGDFLTNTICHTAIIYGLDLNDLMQDEPIFSFKLTLSKPTPEDVIDDLAQKVAELEEQLSKKDEGAK